MPLNRIILIIVSVICAAVITVWVAGMVANQLNITDNTLFVVIPLILVGLVLWRIKSAQRK